MEPYFSNTCTCARCHCSFECEHYDVECRRAKLCAMFIICFSVPLGELLRNLPNNAVAVLYKIKKVEFLYIKKEMRSRS